MDSLEKEVLLADVKTMLMITGTFHDPAISLYIDEALDYMKGAGVAEEIAEKSTGVIAGIVNDLMTGESGKGEISPFLKQRVIQLTYRKAGE